MKSSKNIGKFEIAACKALRGGQFFSGASAVNKVVVKNDFTPCVAVVSLLKKFHQVARNALPGYVILISPACSSFDQFGKNQGAEKMRTRSANALAPTTGSRNTDFYRYMQAVAKKRQDETIGNEKYFRFAPGFFEEKPRRKNNNPTTYLKYERTLTSANN